MSTLGKGSSGNLEHWWCPQCGTFDGPHFEGACDVCAEGDVHTSVEGLVEWAEVERLRERLLQATPHDHSTQVSSKHPIYGCPRCRLEQEFSNAR